ncbi:MAG: hypothetical protein FJ150_10455 [Euryarchaeota archaeon]|nr:hypothetical protein [Euryarchaeota archaeon]
MDPLTTIIMIVLFFILLVFIFSTALLTPIIGKKNLLFVIFLGFLVGAIGGAFFISPIIDDIPNTARYFYQYTENSTETIDLEISTNMDIVKFIEDTKSIEGVKGIESSSIIIKTFPFSNTWAKRFEKRIPTSNKDIKSVKISGNDTILLEINYNSNPEEVIDKLSKWMILVSGIGVKYSIVHVSVKVEASKVDQVIDKLSKQDIVITGINGPVEEKIKGLKEILPNKSNIIIFCGFIGILAGLVGIFIDTIMRIFTIVKNKLLKRE